MYIKKRQGGVSLRGRFVHYKMHYVLMLAGLQHLILLMEICADATYIKMQNVFRVEYQI